MAEIMRLYSKRCWTGGAFHSATVSVENGIITSVEPGKSAGATDLGNDILMPGVIDAHVHINEPGRTAWEGFVTATQAAAAGGITTVADMPLNASPVTTSVPALNEKIEAAKEKLYINVALYGGLVPGNQVDLEPLLRSGVSGIKCFLVHSGIDEFPNVTEKDLERAMPLIARYQLPLLAHCEIYDQEEKTELSDNPGSYKAYLASRPKKWENDAVALMIRLCRKYNCPVHIVHVSSAEALTLIAAAKAEGLPLTAETCTQYIYFDAESIPDNNTLFKCAPPIREKENNKMLKEALATGILDFITTDHSPAPPDIKETESGNLQKAWGGIAGLQFLLPASWTALKDSISLEKFIPLLTSSPARFLKATGKGEIKAGHDADFVIWSPDDKFEVKMQDIRHRHKLSPYTGHQLYGVVKQTIVGGKVVYEHNQGNTGIKAGKLIFSERK